MMRFRSVSLVVPSIFLLLSFTQNTAFSEEEAAKGQPTGQTSALSAEKSPIEKDDILASVNGQHITGATFAQYFYELTKQIPGKNSSPQQMSQLLNQLINSMVLSQEAVKKKLDQQAAVKTRMDLLRWDILTQVALQTHLSDVNPTDDELKTIYEEKYSGPPKMEYKARHILLEDGDEEKAKNLIGELDRGADFAELATKNSTDPTAKNGGDLGWFQPAIVAKPFSEALQKMKKGSYSKEPVKTQFGWHVILVEDSQEIPHPDFEATRKELVAGYQQQAMKSYIENLRRDANIEINPKFAKKSPPE